MDIKNINEFAKITDTKISPAEKNKLQKVIDRYPVKLTPHLIKLIKKSDNIKKQFFPDVRELNNTGITRPWVGQINTGIYGLERMYKDRCILLPIKQCPAYCRHCIRKDYISKSDKAMSYQDINKAINYISKNTEIKEVLITGGDPLMDINKLDYIIQKLNKMDTVKVIRIGTRSIMYDPGKINTKLLAILKKTNKQVEMSCQFNHVDELSTETINACKKLINSGIKIYNQSVLLKGINDKKQDLYNLFSKLREIGIDNHYLYHCANTLGTECFRTSIQKGIEIKRWFRAGNLSGRANPAYIIILPIGKAEPYIDCDFINKKKNVQIIRSSYKEKDLKKIDKKYKLPNDCFVNKDGYIVCKYVDGKD